MKNIVKIILTAMTFFVLMAFMSSCGGNAVKKELEQFINDDMAKVNMNYKNVKTAVSKWNTYTANDEFIASITGEVLPNIENSIAEISKISPRTDEVKALKNKYSQMLNTYKDGYEKMLYAFENDNSVLANEGKYAISKAIDILNEYNKELEKLAKENNLQVNY